MGIISQIRPTDFGLCCILLDLWLRAFDAERAVRRIWAPFFLNCAARWFLVSLRIKADSFGSSTILAMVTAPIMADSVNIASARADGASRWVHRTNRRT